MNKKLLTIILIVGLAALAFAFYQRSATLAAELKKLTVMNEQLQTGNNPESIAEAQAIIERVRQHIEIPTDVEPTVATIVDVEALKSGNDFYKLAKNGDHLIVTPTRAILYDPDRDMILDVVPVQLQTPEQAAAASLAPTN
ncbi:MAG: hypothetical protein KBC47_04485 [Candidatus Peribacteraceae bacterium]|nr:hypothetical protein [Candidatus Peribacteraceae bacterium]